MQTTVIDIVARFTDQTSQGLSKTTNASDKLGNSLKKTQQQADKLGKSKSELKLIDKATQVIHKVSKTLKGITKKAWNVSVKVLDKATAPIRGIFKLLKNPLMVAGAVIGVSVGVKDTIDTYANFESTMSQVKAISGATASDMSALNKKAKEIGATTKFTAIEAAQGFTYMSMAGWKAKEMIGGIEGITNLTAASGEDLAKVSDIVTDAMTAFKLSADGMTKINVGGVEKEVANATHFADVLAAASANSNTNVAMLGESFKYCAPLAGQFGFSIEDTALALGILANSGIKASNSGTAMRKIFTQLSSDFEILQKNGSKITVRTTNDDGSMRDLKNIIDDTRAAFNGISEAERSAIQNDLANTANGLGIALTKENGVLKTQAELYDEVMESAQGLTDAGKVAEAEALAGKTAMAGLLTLVGSSEEDFSKLADAVYNADGAAAKMAATMMDNLKGDFTLFQSAAEGVKLEFMEKLAPSLRKLVQWVTSKMPDMSKTMGKVATSIAVKLESLRKNIEKFTGSPAWKNADFFGKIKIAWDEIIAKPFSDWWSSKGKAWFATIAGKIGNGIGSGLSAGIMGLLGISPQNAVSDGISIGASFGEGFAKGFDGKKVGEAILNALKGVFKDAATLLPGGEKTSSTAGLSAAVLAYGGYKVGKGIFSIGKGISTVGGALTGTAATGAAGAGTAAASTAGTAATVGLAGKMIGSASAGTGLLGLGSNTAIALGAGNLAGGASLSAGALSAVGLGSIAGGVVGLAGAGAGVKDIAEGNTARGASKIGMVGVGAAIGAGIVGSIVPGIGHLAGGLIGAGIGGIGALLTNKVWKTNGEKDKEALEKKVTEEKEKQKKLEESIQSLYESRNNVKGIQNEITHVKDLKKQWNDVRWELDKGNLTEEQRMQKQQEMNSIVSELAAMYPGIISAGDEDNKNLGKKLDTLNGISETQQRIAELELRNQIIEFDRNFDEFSNNHVEAKTKVEDLEQKQKSFGDKALLVNSAIEEWNRLEKLYQASKYEQERAFLAEEQNKQLGIANYGLSNMGINKQYTSEQLRGLGTDESTKEIDILLGDYWQKINQDLLSAYQELQAADINLQEGYLAKITEIESGVGEPLDEAINKYSEMDSTQKAVFNEAIRKVAELNSQFGLLVEPKYVDIIYRTIGGAAEGAGLEEGGSAYPYATGGIVNRPHLGLVGEAGPEAIIPLSDSRKGRGISLWKEAGRRLGMYKEHAEGGIFGNVLAVKEAPKKHLWQLKNDTEEPSQETETTIQAPVTVNLGGLGGVNFTFNGSGNADKDTIMQVIREQMPEVADEVASTIAVNLQRIFANMRAGLI